MKPANPTISAIPGSTNKVRFSWIWPLPASYNYYHNADMNATRYYRIDWDFQTKDGIWVTGSKETVEKGKCYTENDYNVYEISVDSDSYIAVRAAVYPRWDNSGSSGYYTDSVYDLVESDFGLTYTLWGWEWSDTATFYLSNMSPEDPETPELTLVDKNKLTVSVSMSSAELKADAVLFQICNTNDMTKVLGQQIVALSAGHAEWQTTGAYGTQYSARCKTINLINNNISTPLYSVDWSDWSDSVYTCAAAPTDAPKVSRQSSTSVYVSWSAAGGNSKYKVQYTNVKTAFDDNTGYEETEETPNTNFTITGLDSGYTYYFRYVVITYDSTGSEIGESDPSPVTTAGIGKKPNIPTTWSSTSTAISGTKVRLYWTHNAADNSRETTANVELDITAGSQTKTVVYTVPNTKSEDEDTGIYVYEIDTSSTIEGITLSEGATIDWKVQTKGITLDTEEGSYSDWSTVRTVKIYTQPTVTIQMQNPVTTYPISPIITASGGNQTPVSYYVTIEAKSAYTTVSSSGEEENVIEGQRLYYAFFNSSLKRLTYDINVNDVNLDTSQTYTMTVTVSMDSGLSASATYDFTVQWAGYDENIVPRINRLIANKELRVISFQVSALDASGEAPDNIVLSIYRKTFDGDFVAIGEDLPNTNAYVTDPHPQFAAISYRIVAKNTTNGNIRFADVNGINATSKGVVMQWDETWTNLQTASLDIDGGVTWSGSMIEILYNIDVSEDSDPDVNLKEYIGREHPVSYYGTQIGSTASWSMEIPKTDTDTLAKLRKLQTWMGDVYVREPSGSGYWAQVKVSISQTHCELTIPVSLSITRVEGGL